MRVINMVSEIDKAYQRMLDKMETIELSDFSKTIIAELKKLNRTDINELIGELEQCKFDDYHKDAYAFPKMELVDRLRTLRIWGLATDIQMGLFNNKEKMVIRNEENK